MTTFNSAGHDYLKRETQIHPEDIKADPAVCRKKLAQKTFDMTCGGSTYLPTPVIARGMDVLEAAYGKEYAMSVGRSSVNFGVDEIGRLYGKPTQSPMSPPFPPPPPFVDPTGSDKPRTLIPPVLGGTYIPQGPVVIPNNYPCNESDKLKYPNKLLQFLRTKLFPSLPVDDKFNLKIHYADGTFSEIDLSDCYKTLQLMLWCNWNYGLDDNNIILDAESREIIKYFQNCLLIKLSSYIVPGKESEELIHFINLISDRHNLNLDFLQFFANNDIFEYLGGKGWIGVDSSCLCNVYLNEPLIKTKNPKLQGTYNPIIPTYCCNPDPSDPNCFCPDGSLKNLCEDCPVEKDVIIDIPLPRFINYYDKNGQLHCFTELTEKREGIHTLNYTLTSSTGDVVDSATIEIPNLPNLDYDQFRKKLPIKISSMENYTLSMTFTFWCGWCCKPRNKKRVVTLNYYNFSLESWNKIDNKNKFIDLNIHLDADYDTENFFKDCVEC